MAQLQPTSLIIVLSLSDPCILPAALGPYEGCADVGPDLHLHATVTAVRDLPVQVSSSQEGLSGK